MKFGRSCAAVLAATVSWAGLGSAQTLEGLVQYSIVPGWQRSDGSVMAGLRIQLAPGWKTYWRAPGDAGIPPHFDWRSARNIRNVHVQFPAPEVFWDSGMRSIGYDEQVVFPLTIEPRESARDIRLRGDVRIGICSDVCVPITLTVDEMLPAAANVRSPAIVAALANLPYSAQEAGVRDVSCSFSAAEYGVEIEAHVELPSTGGPEESVIEASDPNIWVSDAETERAGERLVVRAMMAHQSGDAIAIERGDVRITVLGQRYSVEIQGCDAP